MALGRSTDLSVDINGDPTGLERAMKSAETATTRAQNAATRYDADLRKLESDLMKLEKSLDDEVTAALERQHDAMDKTGKGMIMFGATLAAALGLAGREAMAWESAWAGVTKTVNGSEQELAMLEAQLRGLAKTLPATHTEIAAVAEAAGQLGIEREAVAGFTKTMIDLGETTNLTADAAATSIAQFMNVLGTNTTEVDRLGSALVELGNNGASTEADILAMAQRLSGAGALIGASESDVLALASSMADLGIEAQLGGGAMSRALTKMYSAVQSGGPELERFAAISGMTAETFATTWSEDPVRAVDAFVKGLAGIQAGGGNVVQALKELKITGTQDLSVLLRLTGAGDRLTESLDRSAEAWEDNSALLEEARKRYETTEARAQVAMNVIRDGAIDIGSTVLPVFGHLVDTVADVGTFFGNLPSPMRTTVTILAAVTAAAALAGGAFLVAVPKVAAFKAAVDGLQTGALKTAGTRLLGLGGILMGPWGVALAAGATALTIFAAKQGETQRKVEALRATLDEQTGAITENSREWAKSELLESGAYDAAHQLGISLELVTDAALGNTDAMEKLRDAIREAREAGEGGLATDLIRDVENVRGAVDEGTTAWQLMAEAGDGAADSTEGAGDAASSAAGAFADGADAAGDMAGEVKTLGEELSELAGSFLSNREAQRAVREQMRGVRDKIKELREEYGPLRDENGKLNAAFRKGTEGGDALAETLDGVTQAMLRRLETAEKNGASEERLKELYKQTRQQLRGVAEDLGMSEDAARDYINEVLGTPKEIRTRFESNLDDAIAKARELEEALRQAAQDRRARIDVTTHYNDTYGRDPYGGVRREADGGWVRGPGGTTDDRVRLWASNGEYVVRASEAAKNGPLLEAINSGRLDTLGPLAGGDVRYGMSTPTVYAAGTGGRAGSGRGGPQEIRGTLNIPGLGEGYIRGVVQSENDSDRSFDRAMAGRGY